MIEPIKKYRFRMALLAADEGMHSAKAILSRGK